MVMRFMPFLLGVTAVFGGIWVVMPERKESAAMVTYLGLTWIGGCLLRIIDILEEKKKDGNPKS